MQPQTAPSELAHGPKHGYALIKDIERFAGVTLGPGILYGVLARLEGAGLVTALPAQERRHPYQITAEGTALLTDQLRRDALLTDQLKRDAMIARVGLARVGVQGV